MQGSKAKSKMNCSTEYKRDRTFGLVVYRNIKPGPVHPIDRLVPGVKHTLKYIPDRSV